MTFTLSNLSKNYICNDNYNYIKGFTSYINIYIYRNPASRASQRARLVAMYIAVAIRLSSYVHRVTSEAVSFLPEVVAQI